MLRLLHTQQEDIRLYVGGDCTSVQGRPCCLLGYRCFTAAHTPRAHFSFDMVQNISGLLDSGAFSDPPESRLTPNRALDRQLHWEWLAKQLWCADWKAKALVSYDLLIDEKWVNGKRVKRRWNVKDADVAVRATVDAAAYLSAQRARLAPRTLVLACQGVDANQYAECVAEVLRYATSDDWIGLGGWCILGQFTSWIPTFFGAMSKILPLIAGSGVRHIHLFGVLYRPVLGGLLWLADQYNLTVSVDSSKPILSAKYDNLASRKQAGALAATWEENVVIWQRRLACLRQSDYYRRQFIWVK